MRTLIGISAGVLGVAAVAAVTLGNAPTASAYGRPPIHAVQRSSTPSPSPSPTDRPDLLKNPYGVMEGDAVFDLAAAPPQVWYLIDLPGSGNSAGYFNAARREAVGRSTVWFPGLDPTGAVLVTAIGTAHPAAHCKAVDVRPSPAEHPGMDVQVACFDATGNPIDSSYSVAYTRPGGRIAGGGAWVRGGEQYNSTGGTNATTHVGVGSYLVRMPGLAGPGGHAQVSAYGEASDWCKVARWYPSGADEVVAVRCFTASGVPADSEFSLIFARGTDAALTSNRAAAFYAWTENPGAAFMTAAGVVTVERGAPGHYRVRVPLDLTGGAAHVTAQGEGNERCNLLGWNNIDGVQIRCHRPDGSPTDADFLVAYAS